MKTEDLMDNGLLLGAFGLGALVGFAATKALGSSARRPDPKTERLLQETEAYVDRLSELEDLGDAIEWDPEGRPSIRRPASISGFPPPSKPKRRR